MPQTTDYIQSNSDTQPTNGYKTRLNKWAIARMLPDMKREVVARFRSRSDADGHMQLLQQRTPGDTLMIVFDCPKEEAAV
jgi:hypothetical protein